VTALGKNEKSRLLVLASKLGYQTRSFAEAARKLGVEVVFGTDRCRRLEDPWGDHALPLRFERPEQAAREIFKRTRAAPVDAILALGDRPTVTAAYAARALGLPYNSPRSVEACRSKLCQRMLLRTAGLPVPEFFSFHLREPLEAILPEVKFPSVVKPVSLAASQGVIRANDARELATAVARVGALLESPEIRVTREPDLDRLLVERYIAGKEVALEGLLTRGELRVLAIFDKPDPLEGPFFEETIYVTPSRLPGHTQSSVIQCARRTVQALALTHGPIHAEFRVNRDGPWVIEVGARPIGGLCSRALRFGTEQIFLEELLVRHALGLEGSDWPREAAASGVMMIPVPQSGVLERVEGLDEAAAVPGIEEIQITARLHDFIAAWPEGASYLGFIFARADSPREVEAALRKSHAQLRFALTPRLPVGHPATGKVPARVGRH
jgi:biotin carboxylase